MSRERYQIGPDLFFNITPSFGPFKAYDLTAINKKNRVLGSAKIVDDVRDEILNCFTINNDEYSVNLIRLKKIFLNSSNCFGSNRPIDIIFTIDEAIKANGNNKLAGPYRIIIQQNAPETSTDVTSYRNLA